MKQSENTARFVAELERHQAQKIVVYGTSLSFHLAPILRQVLTSRYGPLVSVLNAGLPATASRTALRALDERVLQHSPDVVLMEWAVNDAHTYEDYPDDTLDKGIGLQESETNLQSLIQRLQQFCPRCEIVLHTTNPTFDAPGFAHQAGSSRPQLNKYYEVVRRVASARALRLIDGTLFWDALRQQNLARFHEFIPDGIHPTPQALRAFVVPYLLNECGIY